MICFRKGEEHVVRRPIVMKWCAGNEDEGVYEGELINLRQLPELPYQINKIARFATQ